MRRRDGKEMGPILPVNVLATDQAQVDFVHQRRRLKRVTGPLALHVVGGHVTELVIHEGRERLLRGAVPACPRLEEQRQVVRCLGNGAPFYPPLPLSATDLA